MSSNILLILTDQQRWDSLGCSRTPGVHTPNLDRLASEGTYYTQCYVNNPICTPSRASLWTGKHLPSHGVYHLHDILPPDEILFPYFLREAGYDTALFGKLHVAGHMWEMQYRHRFDGFNTYEWAPDPNGYQGCDTAYFRWLAIHHPDILKRWKRDGNKIGHVRAEAHFTTWAANRTIGYLHRMQGAHQPFFCCMSVFDPHSPYTNYPEEYRDRLDIEALPEIHAPDESFDHRPIAHRREANKKNLPDLLESRIGYHAAVALIDEQVGRVLKALDDTNFTDNTVVIFASDHGDMLGDHGLTVKGAFMYDACTRIPMIIRIPGQAGGQSINTPCQLHDLAATALALAEHEKTEHMPDSRNLLSPHELQKRGHAVCMHRNSSIGHGGYHSPELHVTMWREERYKLSVYHSPEPGPSDCPGELFDLENDPGEMNNLWFDASMQNTRDQLIHKLSAFLVQQDTQGRARGEQALPPGFRN
ncbi:MAG: sulfatase-like hydrolase/transferase [Dehalococcoidia bacterium]|jgi:arylsulfatase A-like enzyme|nr:sulfatase-like hydrolase/transferase [Dehalococcoidia bacterium]